MNRDENRKIIPSGFGVSHLSDQGLWRLSEEVIEEKGRRKNRELNAIRNSHVENVNQAAESASIFLSHLKDKRSASTGLVVKSEHGYENSGGKFLVTVMITDDTGAW